MQLRDYQVKMIDKTRELMHAGKKSILLQSPTGSGKTLILAHMAKTAEAQGMRTWFVVHRRELIRQSLKAFDEQGIKTGIIATGWPMLWGMNNQICSVQLLARRYTKLKKPTLIAWDECHHLSAGSWKKIFSYFPEAFHVGLTATPQRLDGQGLSPYFQEMVLGPSVSSLIDAGYLSPYRLYAPSTIDTSRIHRMMGDFNKTELATAADKPTITGDAIKEYLRLAQGKRAVVFCVSIQHSKHVVEQFNAAGIKAEHVDGETPVNQRDEAVRRFSDGETKILSNVELFGEGFDLPAIEVAILLRPTQSLGLYLQQVGRSLRPFPGKDSATILDHAGNCERHGLPDEEREWSLQGSKKTKSIVGGIRVKICPKCFAAQTNRTSCKFCGHVFEIGSKTVDHTDGELTEIDIKAIRQKRAFEQSRAQTYEELVEVGRQRKMPRPELWARYVFNGRQKRSRHSTANPVTSPAVGS